MPKIPEAKDKIKIAYFNDNTPEKILSKVVSGWRTSPGLAVIRSPFPFAKNYSYQVIHTPSGRVLFGYSEFIPSFAVAMKVAHLLATMPIAWNRVASWGKEPSWATQRKIKRHPNFEKIWALVVGEEE